MGLKSWSLFPIPNGHGQRPTSVGIWAKYPTVGTPKFCPLLLKAHDPIKSPLGSSSKWPYPTTQRSAQRVVPAEVESSVSPLEPAMEPLPNHLCEPSRLLAELSDLPPKPPRSKLEPHCELIRELRRKGRTYRGGLPALRRAVGAERSPQYSPLLRYSPRPSPQAGAV
jgi:hypothetical protein